MWQTTVNFANTYWILLRVNLVAEEVYLYKEGKEVDGSKHLLSTAGTGCAWDYPVAKLLNNLHWVLPPPPYIFQGCSYKTHLSVLPAIIRWEPGRNRENKERCCYRKRLRLCCTWGQRVIGTLPGTHQGSPWKASEEHRRHPELDLCSLFCSLTPFPVIHSALWLN